MTAMQRVNVAIKAEELLYVYDFIDENRDGKLQYKELADVLQGKRQIRPEEHIAARRVREGVAHGYTDSELAMIMKGSKNPSFDREEARTAGSVSGLSSLMRVSDPDERKVPPLVDPNEHSDNLTVIRAEVSKAGSFDEILSKMTPPVARGSSERVTFNDFCQVIIAYCGPQRFSGFQMKHAFRELAVELDTADRETLAGAYIPMKLFKDRFYPGRPWSPRYEDNTGQRARLAARAADETESVTSQSVAISTIMKGKTNDDLQAERDLEERKMLMEEQLRKNAEAEARGDSLYDEFEKASVASQPVDDILRIRAQDPRLMKPENQTKDGAGAAFVNPKYYRQAETMSLKQKKAATARQFD